MLSVLFYEFSFATTVTIQRIQKQERKIYKKKKKANV